MNAPVEISTNAVAHCSTSDPIEPLVTFYKAYPDALPAMSADRSALGTIPAQAYQYCEALTTASAFGWYAFPAASITLYFDGVDIYRLEDNEKIKVGVEQLSNMDDWWNIHCPPHLIDMAPPFITSLGIPGYVQIWSGLLIKSRKNWSSLIRPIANACTSNQYFCFEGIVETDSYAPAPLFINLKLQVTHTPITLSAHEPLFQVQPIHRQCYAKNNLSTVKQRGITATNSDQSDVNADAGAVDWTGYAKTVRHVNPAVDMHQAGQYASTTRKRGKKISTSS